jgi:hypothetical protein
VPCALVVEAFVAAACAGLDREPNVRRTLVAAFLVPVQSVRKYLAHCPFGRGSLRYASTSLQPITLSGFTMLLFHPTPFSPHGHRWSPLARALWVTPSGSFRAIRGCLGQNRDSITPPTRSSSCWGGPALCVSTLAVCTLSARLPSVSTRPSFRRGPFDEVKFMQRHYCVLTLMTTSRARQ